MNRATLTHMLRQTLTIARRDFVATVYTPTFLLFLLAPLFMLSFGLVGGLGAASVAGRGEESTRVVAIVDAQDGARLAGADQRLRTLWGPKSDGKPGTLRIDSPTDNVEAQARALFDSDDIEVDAVLFGPIDHPHIYWTSGGRSGAAYLAQLAEAGVRARRIGTDAPLTQPMLTEIERSEASISGKSHLALFGVFGLFLLTLMLSSQTVGTMAEEKSNKVIEILAAAVPLESVFFGKLLGMFGVAILFLIFWGTVVANLNLVLPIDIVHALSRLEPAVGYPAFPILFLAYFAMSFLLMGAVFLAVGAQAASQREIQMLALPITIFQVAMLYWASNIAGNPDGWVATLGQIFPFSSPLAMIARAANLPGIAPHLIALAWQALWVAIAIAVGARWFSRGVLQSGGPRKRKDAGGEAMTGAEAPAA